MISCIESSLNLQSWSVLWLSVVDVIAIFRKTFSSLEQNIKMAADLTGQRMYSCFSCRNLVSRHDDIVSKSFQVIYVWFWWCREFDLYINFLDILIQASHGRAYLFSHAMNIIEGPKEDRHLLTGLHRVADVYCGDCRQMLGWKYDRAYQPAHKYKEGKVVLEKFRIVKDNW